ncbi:hypothetical protein VE00_09444 [Pseudogymnoascus sp. WSF 3629]|nr:hypothetical protein VE00_09444 [Pseudogymnoascus sp. WSF 3629]
MTNVPEQSGDSAFKSALKQASNDLTRLGRIMHNYNGGMYTFPQACGGVSQNLREDAKKVEESRTLGKDDAPDFKLLFQDLGTTSKALQNEFAIKKNTIQANSNCKVTRDAMMLLLTCTDRLVEAIVKVTDPEVQGLVKVYAEDYTNNLKAALHELNGLKD